MTLRRKALLTALCWAMALSWMDAWAAFIMPILGYPPLSVADEAFIPALAMGVTFLHRKRGLRIVSVIGFQAIGLALALYFMGHILLGGGELFASGQWLRVFCARQHTLHDWVGVALSVVWTVIFWILGVRLVVKSPQRYTVTTRFDAGAAAFLLLLLIRLIMVGKGVPVTPVANIQYDFLAYLMFGLLALGMGEQDEENEKNYIYAWRGIGPIIGFTIPAVLLAGGLLILFLPSLMIAAKMGHSALKVAAGPVVSILIMVLRFIFLGGCQSAREGYGPSGREGSGHGFGMMGSGEPGLFQSILSWGFMAITVITGLVVLTLFLCWLIRWLLSRTHKEETPQGLWTILFRLFALIGQFFAFLISIVMRDKRHTDPGVYGYLRLQRWGARCGLPRSPQETPIEYGGRLIQQFPGLGNDIPFLIDLYNHTVFGRAAPDRQEFNNASRSLKRLASPRHWPARLRTWFLPSSK